MKNNNAVTGNKRKKIAIAVSVAMVCIATFVVGAITVSAGVKANGTLLSCDFNNASEVTSSNAKFEDGKLHLNNGHLAGNSKMDAQSYVKFDGVKELASSDFTVAFDYFANEPTDMYSTILSTGPIGKGVNIFNKGGLGISIGEAVMTSQYLTNSQLAMGSVRLDRNMLNDGNWHSVLLTVARKGDANLYVDGFFREKMMLEKIKNVKLESKNVVIGATSDLKFGSEDMYIDNLRIYNKVCDKNGNTLFDEYRWLVATKKANQVIADYKGIAEDAKLTALRNAVSIEAPKTKAQVKEAYNNINNAIVEAVKSAESKMTMNFQILSDTHMADGNNYGSKNTLEMSLDFITEQFAKKDALVVTGDLTDNGYENQYDKFYDALRKHNTAPYTMNITGNHESSYNDSSMQEDNKRFLKYNNAYTKEKYGFELDKVYYDKWIKGYHMIGLGSEETLHNGGHGYYSPEQIQFLKDKLSEAESGKNYNPKQPIFVFNHQPLNNTVPYSDEFGVGPQSDELTEIFKNYPQIVYVSGHVHNGYIGMEAIYNEGYGMLVDTPCLRSNEAVRYRKNIGYNVSAYGTKLIITPVNFTDKDVMYDMTIVVDDKTRETKSAKYDVNDVVVTIDNVESDNRLVDNLESTYAVIRKDKEVVYTFNSQYEIDGLRIGTTFFNKPTTISVATSKDGKTFGAYTTYNLDTTASIQKLFFETQSVKGMKFKFDDVANITMLMPTSRSAK